MAGAQAVRYGQVAGARDEYSYLLEWTTAARRLRPALRGSAGALIARVFRSAPMSVALFHSGLFCCVHYKMTLRHFFIGFSTRR